MRKRPADGDGDGDGDGEAGAAKKGKMPDLANACPHAPPYRAGISVDEALGSRQRFDDPQTRSHFTASEMSP